MALKVYIDDEEIEFKKGHKETIGPIIREINDILESEKKVAYSILINGKNLKENYVYNLNDAVIEVSTISENEYILDGLKNIEVYGNRYLIILEELVYCHEDEIEAKEKELLMLGKWFQNLLEILVSELKIDVEIPKIKGYIKKLKATNGKASEMLKQGDKDGVLELLENEIIEVVYDVYKMRVGLIDTYNEIRNKMRFLN